MIYQGTLIGIRAFNDNYLPHKPSTGCLCLINNVFEELLVPKNAIEPRIEPLEPPIPADRGSSARHLDFLTSCRVKLVVVWPEPFHPYHVILIFILPAANFCLSGACYPFDFADLWLAGRVCSIEFSPCSPRGRLTLSTIAYHEHHK